MAFLVDIPTDATVGNPDGPWKQVAALPTKMEAVAWIRRHIGPCDEDGNLCLITDCPDTGEDRTVHVYVEGGVVQDVEGLPAGWQYEIHDADLAGA